MYSSQVQTDDDDYICIALLNKKRTTIQMVIKLWRNTTPPPPPTILSLSLSLFLCLSRSVRTLVLIAVPCCVSLRSPWILNRSGQKGHVGVCVCVSARVNTVCRQPPGCNYHTSKQRLSTRMQLMTPWPSAKISSYSSLFYTLSTRPTYDLFSGKGIFFLNLFIFYIYYTFLFTLF